MYQGPPISDTVFKRQLNNMLVDKILFRLEREGAFDNMGLNAVSTQYLDQMAEQYVYDCLAGLDGLDGFLSKTWKKVKKVHKKVFREIRRPMKQLRKKLGIKTPAFLKKIEAKVKKVGYKIDKYKVQIAAAAAVVTGAVMFGPQIIAAMKSAGAWTMNMAKPGLAKLAAVPGKIGTAAKTAAGYLGKKFSPPSAAELGKAKEDVASPGFFQKFSNLAKEQLEKVTGMKFSSEDAQALLGGSLKNERNKMLRKLSTEERKAAAREGTTPTRSVLSEPDYEYQPDSVYQAPQAPQKQTNIVAMALPAAALLLAMK